MIFVEAISLARPPFLPESKEYVIEIYSAFWMIKARMQRKRLFNIRAFITEGLKDDFPQIKRL